MYNISEVVLSVFDIERACTPLVEAAGYIRTALPDAPAAQCAAWHVPEGCTRIEQVLLSVPGETIGHIRVVKFHGVSQELIRPSQRTWDSGGIFDLDMFCSDARGLYRDLQQTHGWSAFGEPVDYVMGEFDVTQVVAIGPDGLNLAIIQPYHPETYQRPRHDPLSRVFNSTQLVRDFDAALAFYRDILGWQPLFTLEVGDAVEPGADVLGLPMPFAQHCRRRVGIVHPRGDNDGSIELIQNVDMVGQDYADRAVAPNVGLLVIRLTTPAPADYAREIVARGGTLYAPPARIEIAPYGVVETFSIRTPDGAIVEFIDEPAT